MKLMLSSMYSLNWDELFSHHRWQPSILIVDDNPVIHQDIKKTLFYQKMFHPGMDEMEREMFGSAIGSTVPPWFEKLHIDSATQGEQAVNMVKQRLELQCPYFLVFVDVRMPPGIDGIETIKQLWNIQPNLYTVICSAYSDYSWSDIISYLGPSPHLLILQKPFDTGELLQMVYASLQKYALTLIMQETQQQMEDTLVQRTEALRLSEKKAGLIVSSIFDGILLLSKQGQIEMINPSVSRLFGYTEEELHNQSISVLIPTFSVNTDNTQHVQNMQDRPVLVWEAQGFPKYGSPLLLEIGLTRILLDDTHEPTWLCVCRDITERKKTEAQLEHAASHDPLTGLPNREFFYRRLQQRVSDQSATSSMSGSMSAVFFLDLDQFKGVNDTLGHQAGDLLLCEVASRLQRSVRGHDVVARLGGDEFAVLLNHVTNDKSVFDVADRIQQQCRIPFHLQEQKVYISCSIGIVPQISSYDNSEHILRDADIALYQAKAQGRDQYQTFDNQMYNQVARYFQMDVELRSAIEQRQFVNEYQPIVDLATGTICGLEALVRWAHPERGRINPGDFIPLAEEKHLIPYIGRQVLEMACLQHLQWNKEFAQRPEIGSLTININYSAEQLVQINTVDELHRMLECFHIPPSTFKIEITESVLITHTKAARNTLCALKDLGVSVVLDDFGTGYSSLSYLHRFPIDQIKLDRLFIQQLDESEKSGNFLAAIVKMAHALGLTVVAEGIETQHQLQKLQQLQCEFGQGYLFSRPLPPQQLTSLFTLHSLAPFLMPLALGATVQAQQSAMQGGEKQ